MIKNIIFDIGGVLAQFRPREVMRELDFGEDVIAALSAVTFESPLWLELDRGVLAQEEVIRRMKAQRPEYGQELERFFAEGKERIVSPCEYAAGWLKRLRGQGYGIYLLSNYPAAYFDLHSRMHFDFLQHVDGKVVSGYIQMVKPEPEIYQYLLRTYRLRPGECVFIDDRPENVRAAEAEGIAGLVFESYEATDARLGEMLSR